MQTFLPYPDFKRSAQSLDSKRLNKQSVECYQIVLILWRKRGWLPVEYRSDGKPKKGFWNHPAVRMWEGYESMFMQYWSAIINECELRKIKTTTMSTMWWKLAEVLPWDCDSITPLWLGKLDFHASHQSNLNRKDSSFYKFPVPNDLPYIWPKNE